MRFLLHNPCDEVGDRSDSAIGDRSDSAVRLFGTVNRYGDVQMIALRRPSEGEEVIRAMEVEACWYMLVRSGPVDPGVLGAITNSVVLLEFTRCLLGEIKGTAAETGM